MAPRVATKAEVERMARAAKNVVARDASVAEAECEVVEALGALRGSRTTAAASTTTTATATATTKGVAAKAVLPARRDAPTVVSVSRPGMRMPPRNPRGGYETGEEDEDDDDDDDAEGESDKEEEGSQEESAATSPIEFARVDAVPLFLGTGDLEVVVPQRVVARPARVVASVASGVARVSSGNNNSNSNKSRAVTLASSVAEPRVGVVTSAVGGAPLIIGGGTARGSNNNSNSNSNIAVARVASVASPERASGAPAVNSTSNNNNSNRVADSANSAEVWLDAVRERGGRSRAAQKRGSKLRAVRGQGRNEREEKGGAAPARKRLPAMTARRSPPRPGPDDIRDEDEKIEHADPCDLCVGRGLQCVGRPERRCEECDRAHVACRHATLGKARRVALAAMGVAKPLRRGRVAEPEDHSAGRRVRPRLEEPSGSGGNRRSEVGLRRASEEVEREGGSQAQGSQGAESVASDVGDALVSVEEVEQEPGEPWGHAELVRMQRDSRALLRGLSILEAQARVLLHRSNYFLVQWDRAEEAGY